MPIYAYPEGLGELLQVGEGDGVRPWLSRPAEATSELLVTERTDSFRLMHQDLKLPQQASLSGPSSLSSYQMAYSMPRLATAKAQFIPG